jgi:hypothetical protein
MRAKVKSGRGKKLARDRSDRFPPLAQTALQPPSGRAYALNMENELVYRTVVITDGSVPVALLALFLFM